MRRGLAAGRHPFLVGFLFALACAMSSAQSEAAERRHGLSAFGELKYEAEFKNFDYVNPDAPKGGRLATMPTSSINTFNHFNGFILRGDPAEGVGFLFDTVFTLSDLSVVYLLTQGGPGNATQILPVLAYQIGIQAGSLGRGAAIALMLVPLLFPALFLMLRNLKRRDW